MDTYHSDTLGAVTVPKNDTIMDDLLEALREIQQNCRLWERPGNMRLYEIAGRAIARAEGRTNG